MDYDLYGYALNAAESKAAGICREIQKEYGFNIIKKTESRIKAEESIRGKLESKGLPYSEDNIAAHIKDIAGLRLVCPYVSDIYLLAQRLAASPDITVTGIKDYIQNPKPNGYRSMHINLKISVRLYGQVFSVPVEIQLRTIYMNVWAKVEHKLCYKSRKEPRLWLKKRLKACSEYIAGKELQLIYAAPEPGAAGAKEQQQAARVK